MDARQAEAPEETPNAGSETGSARQNKGAKNMPETTKSTLNGYTLEGPFSHDNLTLYLVTGQDRVKGEQYATLDEAMATKTVRVHETGNVGQLAVENEGDIDVFIFAGEIVRGGRQDRALAYDFIVGRKSGRIPIPSFCVESGRWGRRGAESAADFLSTPTSLASKGTKLAAKLCHSQHAVWEEVECSLAGLSASAGMRIHSQASPSSYHLGLEHEAIKQKTEEYIRALEGAAANCPGAIGFAFAIDGEWNCADVFGSNVLFRKLWPKLLRTAAVEALQAKARQDFRRRTTGKKDSPEAQARTADPTDLATLFEKARRREERRDRVNPRTEAITRETEKSVLFETHDTELGNALVHENLIAK